MDWLVSFCFFFFHRGECTISPGTKNVPKSFGRLCVHATILSPFGCNKMQFNWHKQRGFWAIFFNLNTHSHWQMKWNMIALRLRCLMLVHLPCINYCFITTWCKYGKIVLVKLEFYLPHSFRFHSLLFLIFCVCLLYNTIESRCMWPCGTEAASIYDCVCFLMPIANHVFIFQIQTFDGKCRLKMNFERNQPASQAK